MTDGPQQNPDTPETEPDAFPPPPQGPVLRYTPGQQAGGPAESGRLSGGTQQAWTTPAGAEQPGVTHQPWTGQPGAPQPGPEGNVTPAVLALVFGVLALVVPFLPLPLDPVRSWIGFPLAVVGLALGIAGCVGRRPMKALAVIGIVCAALALVASAIMVGNRVADGAHAAPATRPVVAVTS